MIDLESVGKRYTRPTGESVQALDDVSLHIGRGEFVAIVGASGSGKSTLLQIVGLLDEPTAGRYRCEGREMTGLTVSEQAAFRNRKVGFVFQAFHLMPRASAVENVELPLLYSDRDDIAGLGRKALAAVGLAERTRHTPRELSGGEQQRVAIARALVNEPELLLADEPTGNLDVQSAAEVMGIFRELHRSGRTIVLVTHDAVMAAHAERVIRIRKGRIVGDEPAAPVSATEER
jgi:ABC-type lipoprotein export system ATPase subunit